MLQLGKIVADEATQQSHQLADLGGGPRPVLGAEREDRQDFDAEIARRAHRAPQRLDAPAMTFAARQTARRRPASVAIHDDRDVPRHRELGRSDIEGLGDRHSDDLTP